MGIVDCDVHPYVNSMSELLDYMPSGWRQRFENTPLSASARGGGRYQNPAGGLRKDATPPTGGLPGSDPNYVVEDLLDPYDIDTALLLSMQGASVTTWTDPDAASVMVTAINDFILDRWCSLDERFKLAAVVSPHDPVSARDEIKRLSDQSNVVGIYLPLVDRLMGSPYYFPIYEAATDAGLPIVTHPTGAEGTFTGAPPLAGGIPRTYPGRHSLLTQLAQSNLSSLIFDGIHQRFPDLKVIFAEFGFSWIVPYLWRMDHEWQNFRYEVPWLEKPPSENVKEFVRLATQPIDEPEPRSKLWELMEMEEATSLVVFSSDYPHYDNDDPALVIDRIPAQFRDSIARGNIQSLIGERLNVQTPVETKRQTSLDIRTGS